MTETPKVKYAAEGEKGSGSKARAVDEGVQAVLMKTTDPRFRDIIEKVAKAYDLPVHGITVLGGSPYVNVTGLDERVQQKWLSKGWVKTEKAEMLQHAIKENDYLAGCQVTIEFFNYNAFKDALDSLKEHMTFELLKELRQTYTTSFQSEGWASPKSCQAIAYDYVWSKEAGKKVPGDLLVENVNMMAERKASNRAKRAAVGCGLTSVEEVVGRDSVVVDVIPEEVKDVEEKGKEKASANRLHLNTRWHILRKELFETDEDYRSWLNFRFNVKSSKELSDEQISIGINKMVELQEDKKPSEEQRLENAKKYMEENAGQPHRQESDGDPGKKFPEAAEKEKVEKEKSKVESPEDAPPFPEDNTISTIKKQKLVQLYGSVNEGVLKAALEEVGFANPMEVKTDKQAGQLIYALQR